jgi:pyruvate ferredoxin oxidoreductase gamma subunit
MKVRVHGRGGQGVVTAAELLALAAFDEGRFAQAFPSFGSERTGAPVMAFCRISDRPIRLREPVLDPDALIVLDPTLLHQVDLFQGLQPGGTVLVNSSRSPVELGLDDPTGPLAGSRVITVAATDLALALVRRPVPNLVMLGGFAAASGLVSLESVQAAIRERFSGALGEANAAAAAAAHAVVAEDLALRNGRDAAHARTS